MISGFRDWAIAAVCVTLLIGLMFPASMGRVAAQIVKGYHAEMFAP